MSDQRKKNVQWTVCPPGESTSFEGAQLAVLMDLRDELQKLNRVFQCINFLRIPRTLDEIKKNTRKRRRKKL